MKRQNNTRNNYRREIIKLIAAGYRNIEIYRRVGCNPKYPGMVRAELRNMEPEECEKLIAEVTGKPAQDKQEQAPDVGFQTPYKIARGRYVRGC